MRKKKLHLGFILYGLLIGLAITIILIGISILALSDIDLKGDVEYGIPEHFLQSASWAQVLITSITLLVTFFGLNSIREIRRQNDFEQEKLESEIYKPLISDRFQSIKRFIYSEEIQTRLESLNERLSTDLPGIQEMKLLHPDNINLLDKTEINKKNRLELLKLYKSEMNKLPKNNLAYIKKYEFFVFNKTRLAKHFSELNTFKLQEIYKQSLKKRGKDGPVKLKLDLLKVELNNLYLNRIQCLTDALDKLRENVNAITKKEDKFPLLDGLPTLDHIESLINEYNYICKLIQKETIGAEFGTDLGLKNFKKVHDSIEPLLELRKRISPSYASHYIEYIRQNS
ncbi:MAG: hypothetical protein AB3N10_18760 [Allomuricauda sp.]